MLLTLKPVLRTSAGRLRSKSSGSICARTRKNTLHLTAVHCNPALQQRLGRHLRTETAEVDSSHTPCRTHDRTAVTRVPAVDAHAHSHSYY